jgi:5-methylcytosine-specific restriction endonuclease McrA
VAILQRYPLEGPGNKVDDTGAVYHQNGNGHHRLNGHHPVLVLNSNYEPLNVCNIRRAIVLVLNGKAEVLEEYDLMISTASTFLDAPSVIRLVYMIKRPYPRVKLCRREIFIRDNFTCQYCGVQTRDLTLDHIIPRSKNGPHTWENLVSACRHCNHRKGGKTIAEARLKLASTPREPRASRYYPIQRALNKNLNDGWLKFIPDYEPVADFPRS